VTVARVVVLSLRGRAEVPVLLALGSSLGLRSTSPGRARALNRHARIAIGLNVHANVAIVLLARR
jgi:hypothetical protein